MDFIWYWIYWIYKIPFKCDFRFIPKRIVTVLNRKIKHQNESFSAWKTKFVFHLNSYSFGSCNANWRTCCIIGAYSLISWLSLFKMIPLIACTDCLLLSVLPNGQNNGLHFHWWKFTIPIFKRLDVCYIC